MIRSDDVAGYGPSQRLEVHREGPVQARHMIRSIYRSLPRTNTWLPT
jgi:hypothetical protein